MATSTSMVSGGSSDVSPEEIPSERWGAGGRQPGGSVPAYLTFGSILITSTKSRNACRSVYVYGTMERWRSTQYPSRTRWPEKWRCSTVRPANCGT